MRQADDMLSKMPMPAVNKSSIKPWVKHIEEVKKKGNLQL